ncbi:MAG: cupredoxin family copper-binding protein [Clostridiales bacterium]|nr:cupredoxin family copper-binding protein [Clostridiales bacterium]
MKRNMILVYGCVSFILLLLIAMSAGCQYPNSATSSTTTSSATASATSTAENRNNTANEILIEGNKFKPDILTIKVGESVTWVNKDSYNHTVTSSSGLFDSKDMAFDTKFSFKFEKEDMYDYICGIHTTMKGKIIVQK